MSSNNRQQQKLISQQQQQSLSDPTTDQVQLLEELFQRADVLMFKEKDYTAAEKLYRQILELDPLSIDAINSIAYCLKFKHGSNNEKLFELMYPLYQEALRIDKYDIEANFNLALLFLQQKQDLNQAMHYFQQSLKRDQPKKGLQRDSEQQQIQELYRAQFAKAYYNIGMIYDRLGEIANASAHYKKAIEKCEEDESKVSMNTTHYMKAMTNYAVTLEKLGKRQESIQILDVLKSDFKDEVRIYNNLGIIQKRNNLAQEATESYSQALQIDQNSFFPNYNMGVLKASQFYSNGPSTTSQDDIQAIQYFEAALKIAKANQEDVYEINVLVNMALVYERKGEIENAIARLEHALSIDPQNQKIQQKLQQLKQQISKKQNETKQKEQKEIEEQKKEEEAKRKKEKEEQDKKLREEQENKRKLEELERKQRLEQEKKETEEQERKKKEQEEIERKAREEKEKKLKQEQEKLKQQQLLEEQERKKKEQEEAALRQQQQERELQKKMKEERLRKALEEQQKKAQEEENDRIQKELQLKQQEEESKLKERLENEGRGIQFKVNDKKVTSPTVANSQEEEQKIRDKILDTPKKSGIIQNQQVVIERKQSAHSRAESRQSTRQHISNVIKELDIDQSDIVVKHSQELIKKDDKIKIVDEKEYDEINDKGGQLEETEVFQHNQQLSEAKEEYMNQQPLEEEFKENDPHRPHHHHHHQEEQKRPDTANSIKTEDDFMQWSREHCNMKLQENERNVKALFRLGLLEVSTHAYEEALIYLTQVLEIESSFMTVHLYMKIGEAHYKLEQCDKSLDYFKKAKQFIAPKEDYLIELFMAKCFDKMKKFNEAIIAYEKAVGLYRKEEQQEAALLGNILFRLGWAYVRSKQSMEKGVKNLKEAHTYLKSNTEILLKLSGVLFKEFSDEQESLYYIDKLITIQPDNSEAHMLKGKILEKKGIYSEAIDSFNIAIRLQAEQNAANPPKATAFFYLGQCYDKLKEYKKSILNYKKCLTLDNKNFNACIHLANLLANLGEGQRAAKYFKHAIKIDPSSQNAHFGLGKTLQQFSDNKDAPIEHFQNVIKMDPTYFKAHTQLGILYLDKEEYEKSAEYLKHALSINKSFPLALVSMGNLLFETGHAEEAIKYHKQALIINDKELQALIGLGNAYYDSQSPKEAIEFYKRALEIDDQLSDVHYNLGNALYLIESIEDAVTHYRAAIALNPKKSESFYNLGNALCVKNDYNNAISSYQQALELDPRNAPALYNLGNAFYMINKFEDAIKVYVKALEINEKSPECHFNLASAYNDISNHNRAVFHYVRSIELDEKNIDAYICLGGVYENMKANDKAEKYYKMALEKDPGNSRAIEALKKVKSLKNK